ncbi:hypothetical protein J6590_059273 [Homalodisca vitripennis]|nr:hypothetical protein J6590_059273 [Homalodisca vitripennis]
MKRSAQYTAERISFTEEKFRPLHGTLRYPSQCWQFPKFKSPKAAYTVSVGNSHNLLTVENKGRNPVKDPD